MSTISNAMSRPGNAASRPADLARKTLRRWWQAYIARRAQQAAIRQLQAMSDRELKDIGLYRAHIETAVRGSTLRDQALMGSF